MSRTWWRVGLVAVVLVASVTLSIRLGPPDWLLADAHPVRNALEGMSWPAGTLAFLALFVPPLWRWVRGHYDEAGEAEETEKRREPRIRVRFVEWMRQPFAAKYRKHVLAGLRYVDLKGLATPGIVTPELDEVYVHVSLVPRPAHEVGGLLTADEAGKRHDIDDFLDQERPRLLAVIGTPGSGKTTLLRHTARMICREQERRRRVPILIYLRDHVEAITGKPPARLADLVRVSLGDLARLEPGDWLELQLRNGNCVVLFDGLDEVARAEYRRAVSAWVERQTRQYPGNDFVITSRPQGYSEAPVEGAAVLATRPLSPAQVTVFVRTWYTATERITTGARNEDVDTAANLAADDLLTRLRGAQNLADLTTNPLLLTMIANVHRYRGALPGRRVDLYGEICQVMLWRRQAAKQLRLAMPGERLEVLLRAVAHHMMVSGVRELPAREIVGVLDPLMRRISTPLTSWDVLVEVVGAGLLVEREQLRYAFAHLTFQEYLAAVHIRDRGLATMLTGHVDDSWWRETTLLYSTLVDGDQIVAACLRSNGANALALAFDCIQDGADLDAALRDRTLDLLDRAQRDDCPDDVRTLVTKVLTTRLLRDSATVDSGAILCRAPVPNRLLQLWYRAKRADSPVPWNNEPATGMPLSDAKAFSAWLATAVEEPGIRLPTAEELGERAAVLPGHFAWTSDGLHVPSGEHPHHISRTVLQDQLAVDLDPEFERVVALLRVRAEAKSMGNREEATDYQRWMKPFLTRAQLRTPYLHTNVSVMRQEIIEAADAALQETSLAVRELFDWEQDTADFTLVAGKVIRRFYRYAHGRADYDADSLRLEFARAWPDDLVVWPEPRALMSTAQAVCDSQRSENSWEREMWKRLVHACEKIADASRGTTAQFRQIRLLALFLAAQAETARPIHQVAALAMVIERRQAGVVPASEVVHLLKDAEASSGASRRG
ncbi:NACHT domain-containing protein [Amycolatopsis sp. NPDC089917]|uniref:NACHT domain-containing protein n=1 Tax=Amycolatopsis sp. NPDC089917 TaxID=3155187 RepID=UPI0034193CFD